MTFSRALIITVVVAILILLGIGFYILRQKLTPMPVSLRPSPQILRELPVPTPTSSQLPEIDRSGIFLRVLNGTATKGLASSASAKLKELGYNIEKTGNATQSATSTVVRVKISQTSLLEQLIKDLMPDFEGLQGSDLPSSDPSDAEIILGDK